MKNDDPQLEWIKERKRKGQFLSDYELKWLKNSNQKEEEKNAESRERACP